MQIDKRCSLDFWGDGSPRIARVERKRCRKRIKAIDRREFPGEEDLAWERWNPTDHINRPVGVLVRREMFFWDDSR